MMRRSLAALFVLALGAGFQLGSATAFADSHERRYVVVLDDSADRPAVVAKRHAGRFGAEPQRVLNRSINGYSAAMTPAEAKAVARQPGVAAVGPDPVGEPAAQSIPTGVRRIFAADNNCLPGYSATTNQHVDVDCRDDVRVDVDIAILDTPIDPENADLDVVTNVNCFAGDPTPEDDDPGDHAGCEPGHGELGNGCFGLERHGELVAEQVAAIDNEVGVVGVAPGARIWSVGVADLTPGLPVPCDPPAVFYLSDVIAGVEWVSAHADEIEVANMSLQFSSPTDPAGEALDAALETAINASIDEGVVYVAAAGNASDPLTGFIPAKYEQVITATAIHDSNGLPGGSPGDGDTACGQPNDQDDTNADASNYGPEADFNDFDDPGADLAAPGDCTSFAAAYASGAAALLASDMTMDDESDVAAVRNILLTNGETASKANGGWDDDADNDPQEPLLDVSNEAVFDPRLTSPFWAHTPSFEAPCPDVSRSGNAVSGGCTVEDFEGSFDIYAYIPYPYYIGTYDTTFDLVLDSTGEGYAVNPQVSASGPYLSRVACDDVDTTRRPWPVNSYSTYPSLEEIAIDMLIGLRSGGGFPGDACTEQVMELDATQIGWGWQTELDQAVPAPNLSNGHWESDDTTWLLWGE